VGVFGDLELVGELAEEFVVQLVGELAEDLLEELVGDGVLEPGGFLNAGEMLPGRSIGKPGTGGAGILTRGIGGVGARRIR
jgi:hypothetical protein